MWINVLSCSASDQELGCTRKNCLADCSTSRLLVGAGKDSAVAQGSEPRLSSAALPATLPLADKLGQ